MTTTMIHHYDNTMRTTMTITMTNSIFTAVDCDAWFTKESDRISAQVDVQLLTWLRGFSARKQAEEGLWFAETPEL